VTAQLRNLVFLTSLIALAACSSDSNDDPGDVCEGVSTCTLAGQTCSGDALVNCVADANGCLVESSTDCSADGQLCDDASGTATCVASCDDPLCAGLSAGEGFCDGSIPVLCEADTDGCLLPVDGTACGNEVCDDESAATPACVANGSGDSCAAAFIVQDDLALTGDDIRADYSHVEGFDGTGCAVTSNVGTPPEAVFAVELVAGQTVHLSEHGGVDAVLGILPTCDGATECYAAEGNFGAESNGISYTASADETVFAYVSAFEDFSGDPPHTTDYDIRFAISECGDGVTEGGEQCDDANEVDGDGCSSCGVDLGFECDNTTVSVCTGPIDLGTYAAAETIPETTSSVALEQDGTFFYRITFTENVLISGTLHATGGEDIDLGFFDAQENLVFSAGTGGGEVWVDELLAAGTYTILLLGFDAIPNGWTLNMSTIAGPICGDGIVGVGEECDDNMVDNDGCTACTVDLGFVCDNTNNPSVCVDACGNGDVDPGEECDDGNAVNDDRCADACLLNADVVDAAGNDTFGTAQALLDGQVAKGSLDPSGTDEFDIYSFTLAEASWVTAETYTTVDSDNLNYSGAGLDDSLDCSADPDVHLFDNTGDPTDNSTSLVSDDADGDFFCGYVGPATDGSAVLLAAGTYFIKINEFFDSNAIPLYALDLQIDPVLGVGEACSEALDLCDPATLSCSGGTCVGPAEDRANYEEFVGNQFDLADTSLHFSPNGDDFDVAAVGALAFPDVPGTGTVSSATPALTDDGSVSVAFGFSFPFFGVDQSSVFVNANGNLSFGAGDATATESVAAHFTSPRISFFFDDLRPDLAGTVTVDEFVDRLTVTFDGVQASAGNVQAQVQLFSNGNVVITYLSVTDGESIVGISAGDAEGNPPAESDFSTQLAAIPAPGDLIFNEIMANPNFVSDTNCDTEFSSTRDEFLEIVNISGAVLDLTGVTITDNFTTRHTFGPLVLADRQAVVVYGGGTPSCPGVLGVVSSTGLLGLNNTGDTLTLGSGGEIVDAASYTSSTVGISSTLDPDLTGSFVDHVDAAGAVGNFSPGFRVSGQPF
jgi:cysteine-rich repeat protein